MRFVLILSLLLSHLMWYLDGKLYQEEILSLTSQRDSCYDNYQMLQEKIYAPEIGKIDPEVKRSMKYRTYKNNY